jgi:hypothetical protein
MPWSNEGFLRSSNKIMELQAEIDALEGVTKSVTLLSNCFSAVFVGGQTKDLPSPGK